MAEESARIKQRLTRAGRALCAGLAACLASTAVPALALDAPWCDRLAARLPTVSAATCRQSAVTPSGAKSNNGFPILERDIAASASNTAGANPPRVLLLGGIHGDEPSASALVFRWLQSMDSPPPKACTGKSRRC